MALHTPKIDQLTDAYAVAQLHHEMKIVGIVASIEEAQKLAAETGNLGYPTFIFPVPLAYIPQATRYAQAGYK